jgi:hypothetical protein
MAKSWRDYAAPIIARVLKEAAGQDEKTIKKALHDAYPFGERAMHPYKIWCDEVRRQRGIRPLPTVDKRRKLAEVEANNPSLFTVCEQTEEISS